MKTHQLKYFFIALISVAANYYAIAQEGFGTSNPNQNAIIDMVATDKGLLMPRIALSATNSFLPMSAHNTGMNVYNTFTGGASPNNVTPGFYYNDGSKWVKNGIGTIRNWNIQNTAIKANAVNQNIYQMGNVGIGTNIPANRLHVYVDPVGTENPIKVENILAATTNLFSYEVLYVKPSDGLIKWGDASMPLGYLIKSIISQRFQVENFRNSSPVPAVITFAATDDKVVDNGFVTLSGNFFTVAADGIYDIYAIINLIADASNVDYLGGTFTSVNLKLQKSTDNISWTDVATSRTSFDVSRAAMDLTLTLTPLVTVLSLQKNDNLRLVINRQAGAYVNADTTGNLTDILVGIRTSGAANGVANCKVFKIIKLK